MRMRIPGSPAGYKVKTRCKKTFGFSLCQHDDAHVLFLCQQECSVVLLHDTCMHADQIVALDILPGPSVKPALLLSWDMIGCLAVAKCVATLQSKYY